MRDYRCAKRKAPASLLGLQSLIAVITLRLLLREEKQGMTTLRLSFAGYFNGTQNSLQCFPHQGET